MDCEGIKEDLLKRYAEVAGLVEDRTACGCTSTPARCDVLAGR
jgi:hypothetical protein